MRRLQFLLILFACLAVVPSPLSAVTQKNGAPVTIEPKPSMALPQKPITLSGNTMTDGKRFEVELRITIPGQKIPQVIKTKCDQKGDFKVVFKQTGQTGTYRVSAKAPDGKGKGTTEFRIVTPAGLSSLATGKFKELSQALKESVGGANDRINQFPSSAERDRVVKKTGELVSKLEQANRLAAQVKPNLDKMLEAIDLPAEDLEGLQAMETINELAEWTVEADQQMEFLKEMLPKERQDPTLCDTIHAASEGLRLAGMVMNFYGNGITIFGNLCVDKGVPNLLSMKYPERSPAWDFGAKPLANATRTLSDSLSGMVGLLNDAVTLITDNLLKRYCGEYSGPIKATMTADFKQRGRSYWKYSVAIEGQFTLRFPKNSPSGNSLRLTGEIFGNATKYTFWEDVEKILQAPKGGQIVMRRPIVPGPFPALYKDALGLGKLTNMALPMVFYIPLEAQMDDDKVALRILDPVKEISDILLKNRLFVVYMAHALPVPLVKHFEFPVEGAHYILTRGMHNPAEIAVSEEGETRLMKKKFTREYESDDKGFLIKWVVDLDASNPGKK